MSKYYISFGQQQTHSFNGRTLDKDCLLMVEAESEKHAREQAFAWFGPVWSMMYKEEELGKTLSYFPRGIIKANP